MGRLKRLYSDYTFVSSPSPSSAPPSAPAEPHRSALWLSRLFHSRWAVPALTELAGEHTGGRFVPLAKRLGVARASLQRALASLIELGLLRRNPGYGHPLRPEYVLLPRGRALAPACGRLLEAAERAGLTEVVLRKWPVAVLRCVADGRSRFSEVEAALPTITARALTLALRELQDAGLVDRVVYDDSPPRVTYRPTRSGRRLAALLEGHELE